jgi:hypothetical protein
VALTPYLLPEILRANTNTCYYNTLLLCYRVGDKKDREKLTKDDDHFPEVTRSHDYTMSGTSVIALWWLNMKVHLGP